MEKITKELYNKSGIYCIINTVNLKKYIGSSKNIYQRLNKHRAYLRKNMHDNQKLLNSWNKHGENNFQYFILEFCNEEKLMEREQFYINTLKPWFNITLEVVRLKMSEESKLKMSQSRKEGFKKGTVKLYLEKSIYLYDLSGNFIQSFKSIKEASEKTKVARSSINRFLEGKYKKGGNFLWSLENKEFLPAYIKSPKDMSMLFKPLEVIDLLDNTSIIYPSLKDFCKSINKNPSSVRHAMIKGYPYLKRYMVKYITAV